ncbi:MAG TPA: ATP-dependent DNA ligase [Acidobacteriaceae bacterium]|nr:ATP-dependent DNA ligase [Acidobacteriaceae bacterium]
MRFARLADLAESLAGEASKLKKRASIAAEVRRSADESAFEAGRFCLYLAGQPFAEADPRKLNAGGAILSRALKEIAGATDSALNLAYRRHGDLGAAAFDLLSDTDHRTEIRDLPGELALADVAEAFETMARARTTAVRSAAVESLLKRASPLEAKYLLKLMLGDMRIGVKQSLVEEAIAEAASLSGNSAEVAAVRHAVMLEADLSRAVERAFAGTLAEARMRLFHPLGFMLASPVETPEEAVERFTAKPEKKLEATPKKRRGKKSATEIIPEPSAIVAEASAEEGLAEDVEAEAADSAKSPQDTAIHALIEDKYDGIRAQVHCGDPDQPGRVAIYSRNREDITESFPELHEALAKVDSAGGLIGGSGLIMDGEILGWDVEAERALPFSVLGQRIGRKRVDDAMRRAIPVIFMAFDLLYANGELLLPRPLRERRAQLEQTVNLLGEVAVSPLEGEPQGQLFSSAPSAEIERLRLSPASMVESADAIDRAYRDARARANEGVMIKAAGSAYLPGRRGLAWLKLKRELATLDVVITGAEYGHGRRAGLLSDYTFAVRGPRGANGEPGELLNVGKAYSGVTDAEIAELTDWLKAHTVEDLGYFRTVEPIRVLEVAFNNVMRSDRHSSGFALRFPRILRVRDDKPVEEIDTLERVEEIYKSQPDRGPESQPDKRPPEAG